MLKEQMGEISWWNGRITHSRQAMLQSWDKIVQAFIKEQLCWIINQKKPGFRSEKEKTMQQTFHKHKESHQLIQTNPTADRLHAPYSSKYPSVQTHKLSHRPFQFDGCCNIQISTDNITYNPHRHSEVGSRRPRLCAASRESFENIIVLFKASTRIFTLQ